METIQQIVLTKQSDGKYKIATMGEGKTYGTNYGSASQTVMMLEILLKQLKTP
jgi:hypothetical protein